MRILFKEINEIKRNNSDEFCYLMFLCVLWGKLTINFAMVFLSKIIGGGPVDAAIVVLEVFFLLLSVKYWLHRIRVSDFLFVLFCFAFYTAGYFADPKISEIIVEKYPYFLIALTYYLIGVTIDFNKFKNVLYWVSLANVLSSSIYYMILSKSLGSNADVLGDHNMVAAYNILPSVILVLWHLMSTFNLKTLVTCTDIITSVLGLMLIFSFGTRGALVCLLFFIVFYVFFVAKIKHSFFIKVLVLSIGLIVYYYLDIIVLYMAGVTEALGMSSRIFTMLIDGTFLGGEASTNERVVLLDTIKDVISRDSSIALYGKGVFGWAKYIYVYPHNFYYEMILTFGYVFSYILIFILSRLLIRGLFSKQSDSNKAFLLMAISAGFVKLFMSGSFVDEYFFYLMIGFAINIKRNKIRTSTK